MKHVQTFNDFLNESIPADKPKIHLAKTSPLIAHIVPRGSQLYVYDISNHVIMQKNLSSGEILAGFSTDLLVTVSKTMVTSFTPECKIINTTYLNPGDIVRGVIGPNILIYRKSGNYLSVCNKNFREITRMYA